MRICTICARGGSKGVKNKNLREIRGLPLIAHSIAQALETGLFDAVAVSSDSDEILAAAKKYGAKILVKRPDEMATDTAAKLPAIQHCFREAEKISGKTYKTAVDLDSTSPLRTAEDIRGAVAMLEGGGFDNILTGAPAHRSPYFNLVELDGGFVRLSKKLDKPVVRRQDAPKCFDLNASIYVWTRDAILNKTAVIADKTGLFEMPPERSLDIDSELDFEIVEFLMGRK